MDAPSSRQRLARQVTVVVLALALVLVAIAAYATWPGDASPRRPDRTPVPACDYASSDWMQQPGCEHPPTR